MANIKKYTKKDGSTAYQFSVYLGVDEKTGKKKRTTRRGFPSKKEAKLALARLELGEDTPESKSYKKYTTFKDVYEMWLPIYSSKVSDATLFNTKNFFKNYILPDFGKMPIRTITLNDCQQAVLRWSEHTVKFKIIKNYTQQVFNYARKNNFIESDPFAEVELPTIKKIGNKKDADKFYTRDELNAFLDWAHARLTFSDFTAFRLMAYTGIRKGELRALTWHDINFKTGTIDINKAIKGNETLGTTKNTSSERVLSLDKETLKVLKKWQLNQRKEFLKRGISVNENQYIFTDEFNQSYMYRDHLRDMMKKYPGKKITIHGFRHTHATLLLNAGANYKEVQSRLGHATADMTMNVYVHSMAKEDKSSKLFANYLKG
ncbi:MAG TPA: site-specific integrase [Candidatus Tetragenococcus pullicola]|nr:site-specific integrase [Candidatus Tetragenococcus pullicola]